MCASSLRYFTDREELRVARLRSGGHAGGRRAQDILLLRLPPEFGQLSRQLFDLRPEFGHGLFQVRDAFAEIGFQRSAVRHR
jgi:hypothetical protein